MLSLLKVESLLSLCINCARRYLTLKNLPKAAPPLLPSHLHTQLTRLEMAHFYINPAHLTRVDHAQRTYPATCLFDGSMNQLGVSAQGTC